MSCAIIGDSIAVGIAQQLPECTSVAKVGISSGSWLGRHSAILDRPQDVLVVSLGSNDGQRFERGVFEAIRARANAKRIIWILPACNHAAHDGLMSFAKEQGDLVLSFASGRDGIHPRSYGPVAARLKNYVQG